MSDDPKTGLELLRKILGHRIEGLAPGQEPSAEQLLKAAIDQPLSLDDLEEIHDFISEQQTSGVNGVMVFDSGKPGPTLGVAAVTHGNEPAGLASLLVLIALQENGLLHNGRVIFTANNLKANEQFFDADSQEEKWAARAAEGDINMNRLPNDVMNGDFKTNGSYAMERARELKRFWHQFDVGVDLHTTSTSAPPMVIAHQLPDERRKYLFSNLPASDTITGIHGYLSGNSVTEFFGGTGKPAITLTMECGQHEEQSSFDVAQNTVITLLENMQMMPTLDREFAHDLNDLSNITNFAHFDFPDWDKGAYKPKDAAIFHPGHDPNLQLGGLNPAQVQAIKDDTYELVNQRPARTHSGGTPVEANNKAVWRNFEDIQKGDVIMRGQKTGFEIKAKKDGQILMAPANPIIKPTQTEAVAFLSAPVKELSLKASPSYKPETWEVEHPAIDHHLQEMVLSGQTPVLPDPEPVVRPRTVQAQVSEPEPEKLGMWGNIKKGMADIRDGAWRVVSSPFRAAGLLPKWEYRDSNHASLTADARTPVTGKKTDQTPAALRPEPKPVSAPMADANMSQLSASTKGQPPSPQDLQVVTGAQLDVSQQARVTTK